MDISCIVLAGGRGVRLGRDKNREIVGESCLLQRVVSSLSLFECEIIIVTANKQSPLPPIDYSGLRIIEDTCSGKGALGGIYTGLTVSGSHYNFIVACDMPFLDYNLIRYIMQLSPGFDAVVPRLGDLVEPLHAIYSKDCLVPIEIVFRQNNLSIFSLYNMIRVRYVDTGEIDTFDPKHRSFFNINTEDDLNMARELVKDYIISAT